MKLLFNDKPKHTTSKSGFTSLTIPLHPFHTLFKTKMDYLHVLALMENTLAYICLSPNPIPGTNSAPRQMCHTHTHTRTRKWFQFRGLSLV